MVIQCRELFEFSLILDPQNERKPPPSFPLAPVGGTGGVPAPGSARLRRARNLQNAPGHTPLAQRTCAAPRLRPVYETRAP